MIGVCCNDQGDYELKVPAGHEGDSVLVRSVGYEPLRLSVKDLEGSSRIRLKSQAIELREVNISRYQHSLDLMLDVLRSLDHNFHQQTAYSTFFYRDWRAVDDEIYLFDESVMEVERGPYNQYAEKRSFNFKSSFREMETNYKTILRHRLLVNDRSLLKEKVGKDDGIDEMMQYADEAQSRRNDLPGYREGFTVEEHVIPLKAPYAVSVDPLYVGMTETPLLPFGGTTTRWSPIFVANSLEGVAHLTE